MAGRRAETVRDSWWADQYKYRCLLLARFNQSLARHAAVELECGNENWAGLVAAVSFFPVRGSVPRALEFSCGIFPGETAPTALRKLKARQTQP